MKIDVGILVPNLLEIPNVARAAEEIGFDGLWTSETQHEPFLPLALAAEHTTRIELGTAIAVAFPLAIAYARRIWRGRQAASAQTDTVAPRLDRLEQAVDAIAIEIERVAEGQRFVTKVLAERGAQAQAHVAPDSPLARDAGGGLGEAKPFLALGAGPIEPIRVAERQAVRQSITPH